MAAAPAPEATDLYNGDQGAIPRVSDSAPPADQTSPSADQSASPSTNQNTDPTQNGPPIGLASFPCGCKCSKTAVVYDEWHHPILHSWLMFLDESTIHGTSHVGARQRHMAVRVFFCVALLCSAVACCYMLSNQIQQYLTFDVKTTTNLVQLDSITFPAVTFCNENIFRKSVVGGSLAFLEGTLAFYASNMAQYMQYVTEYLPYCFNPAINNNLTNELNWASGGTPGEWAWFNLSIAGVMKLTTMDSYQSVLECYWLNSPIVNCTKQSMFLNHMTDYGWCFTFNPSANVINSYSLTDSYGITPGNMSAMPILKSIVNSGPKNGIRLILNAQQNDYCITRDQGAGFRAIVHDPDVQPLFFLENAILLSPGFDVSIAIQVTQIIRNTENLGRCQTFVPLYWYPNATVYFKDACYMGCFSQYVVDQCACFPIFGPLTGYDIYKLTHPVPICFGTQMLCMNNAISTFVGSGSMMTTQCSQCVDPCNEIRYANTLSFQYYPAPTQVASLAPFGITNLTTARDNLLGVNIYVESLQITTITESQAMSFTDLIGAIGGLFGLFLGMSVISITEVLCQIGHSTMAAVRGLTLAKRRKKLGL